MRPTRVMGLAGLSIAMLGASANAEIESEFSLGYADEYIFRGLEQGDSLYEFSFDFSGTCDCGLDWNAGVWYGIYESSGLGPFNDEEEIDLYLGISKEVGAGSLELGFIRYIYPDDITAGSEATELYLSYGTSFNAIDLSAALYYTVDSQVGANGDWYAELTASHSFDITESLSGEFGVGVAFFDSDLAANDGLANYSAWLALTQVVSEDISISPYVSLTSNDSDYDATEAENLNAGIRTTFSF